MLAGKRIMVVEDEALLALDISLTLEDEGAEVSGPFHALDHALDADPEGIDAAVLDVDLSGVPVFPLADALSRQGVPFVFHTGRADLMTLRDRYGPVPILVKPSMPHDVVAAIRSAVETEHEAIAAQ